MSLTLALAGALTATASAQVGGCPTTPGVNYDQYTATSGDWSVVANWAVNGNPAVNALPAPGEVACWDSTTTVTIASTDPAETADSIDAGGDLVLAGTLTLATSTPSTVEDLTLDGSGTIDGPATTPATTQPLTVENAFIWGDTTAGNATVGSTMAITTGTLAIDGSASTPDLAGGSVAAGAVTVTGSQFAASGASPTVTSTGTITFDTASNLAGSGATFTAAGVVPIAGTFGFGNNSLDLNGGTTTLTSGETLDTGPLTISGAATDVDVGGALDGGAVTIAGGTATVEAGSTFASSGAVTIAGGNTTVDGPTGALNNAGALNSAGALTLTSGTLMNSGSVDAASTAISGGTLQDDGALDSAATLTLGTLDGVGTVNGPLTNTSGTVSPGDPSATNSTGVLTVAGAYTQASGGTLAIEINGTTAGSGLNGFSQLDSTSGVTSLGGTLSLSGSYTPIQGDSLAVLTYSSLSPSTGFAHIAGTNAGDYVPQYGATALNLTALIRPANCPTGDVFFPTNTMTNTGDWSTGGTWLPAVPGPNDIACWSTGTTVTVDSGDPPMVVSEVQGGALVIDGGQVNLDSATDASSLATSTTVPADALDLIDGGTLNGFSQTLTVTGNMDWGGTGANQLDTAASPDNALIIAQGAGGSSLTVDGTGSTAWGGGSVTTGTATISNSNLTDTNAPTLTATGLVTFGGVDLAASPSPGTITAAGIAVSATSSVLGFDLDVTADSTLAAPLDVQNLTTAAGTTMAVPTGLALNVYSGSISGTINGAGTFTAGVAAGGATTTIDSGGSLSTADVDVNAGTLTANAGATYDVTGATTVTAGTLDLENGTGTTADLSLSGTGELNSASSAALTVTGSFTWSGGTINPSGGSLAVIQGGTGATLSGTLALDGGSIATGSPVSTSSATTLSTANTPTMNTASTITLGSGTSITGSTGVFSAGGVIAGTGTTGTYGFGGDALQLTGGTTTVASGTTLAASTTTLAGGTLTGTGTVAGPVTNNAGTVAPGNPVGALSIGGNYSQGGSGTLAIEVDAAGGDNFSQLQVVGKTTLGGDLSVTDGGGFVPEPGDTFAVIDSTSTQGAFALTGPGAASYFAVYSPKDVTLNVNPAPANIAAPAITGTAGVGQTLSCSPGTWSANPTSFTYQWDRDGAAISGATGSGYAIVADDQGHALTCTVTASNSFGTGQPATSASVSVPAPSPTVVEPVNTAAPAVSGTPTPGHKLTCSHGTWSGSPTGFTYRWSRGGSSIAGATDATYAVQIADEGSSLKCIVTASNSAGAGIPTSSATVVAAQKGTLTCAKPTGKLSGDLLGRLSLGVTRTEARRTLTHRLSTGSNLDYFCLYGGWGIHAGYPSSKLLRSLSAKQRRRVKGRIVLALTVNPFYALGGARPGMALSAVAKRLHVGKVFRIGPNSWYIAPGVGSKGVLRVRGGIIQEVGIANQALTKGRAAQQRFLTSFNGA